MFRVTALLTLLLLSLCSGAQLRFADIDYFSPQSGAMYCNPDTRIVLRLEEGSHFDQSMMHNRLSVKGELSGEKQVDLIFSKDLTTVNIIPRTPFQPMERVDVDFQGSFVSPSGWVRNLNWSFQTGQGTQQEEQHIQSSVGRASIPELTHFVDPQEGIYEANIFSHVKSPGEAFMSVHDLEGEVQWEQESPGIGVDFKINLNGLPTYFSNFENLWYMMDTEGEIIRTFTMVNGYTPDEHDFQILPNGNYLIFAYDNQFVNMSQVVPGGHPNALVEGFVVQELTYDNVLVMEWRSWDYLEITDNEEQNLLSDDINPFHINSVEVDVDGHIMISCRHTNEITKYHRNDGNIIWRLTINAQGDFNFIDDAGFSFQHDCRGLGNNRILLYDNANLTGQLSRAVEYEIDTVAWTATKVWEFSHPELLFAASRGGCQRLPNGNTIIQWGAVSVDEYGARTTEVSSAGDILLDFAFPLVYNGYRSPKHIWTFGQDIEGGCGDPLAVNYNPGADYWLPEFCGYDFDGDGWADIEGDCNDDDDSINPGADEVPYDGIDQDCDGEDLVDVDGDGFSPEDGDCNDDDDSINPDADEIPYDGIDQDCDGEDLTDVDGDGFTPDDGDCDDDNEDINPDAEEIPYDGIDQDCDGEDLDDVDGDGFSPDDGDCDDENEDINPDAEEIPNDGIDQDCNGEDLIVGVTDAQIKPLVIQSTYGVTISFPGEFELRIFDMGGRLVESRLAIDTQPLSSNQLSPGLYQCLLTTSTTTHVFQIAVR